MAKRLLSILFLAILLFNFCGYRLMIDFIRSQENGMLQARLERSDYSESELISIKTKLNLPYYTSSSELERAHGSIRVNGVDYEYVKRRVYNDTLELLCLPDRAKTHLNEAQNRIFQLTLDGQSTETKKGSTLIRLSLPEYFEELGMTLPAPPRPEHATHSGLYSSHLACGYRISPERPPCAIPCIC